MKMRRHFDKTFSCNVHPLRSHDDVERAWESVGNEFTSWDVSHFPGYLIWCAGRAAKAGNFTLRIWSSADDREGSATINFSHLADLVGFVLFVVLFDT